MDLEVEDAVLTGSSDELLFRDFRLYPKARVVLHGNHAVAIGGRAFDLFHVLLASRGSIVSRAEIVACVWPATFVDESNLRFQICQLRKVLGADRDFLKTVPGRGYLLSNDLCGGASTPTGNGRGARSSNSERPLMFESAPGVGQATGDRDRATGPDSREDWQGLLRSVLDELRQLTSEAKASATTRSSPTP